MTVAAGLGSAFDLFMHHGDLTTDAARDAPMTGPAPPTPQGDRAGHAYLALLTGDLARAGAHATDVLNTREAVDELHITEGSVADHQRCWSVAHAVLGVLATLRGEPAADRFEAGVDGARRVGDRWAKGFVLALWAEFGWRVDALEAMHHAQRAVTLAEQCGDESLLRLADRSRAVAALGGDDVDAAEILARRLDESAPNDTERARAAYLIGMADLKRHHFDSATVALQTCADTFGRNGCRLELLVALLWLSVADFEKAPVHLDAARTLSRQLGDDTAFDRLWAERPALRLDLLGDQRLSVGHEVVRCKTSRAEKLIFSLAAAGSVGLNADLLCERLWPDKERDRAMSGLSTATWEARIALGTEAWRLVRNEDQFWLTMDGVNVDLDEATSRLDRDPSDDDALVKLREPVLPAWRFEDWVVEIDERRAAILARHDDQGRKHSALDRPF